jgi:MinD-like ATPase involved in chromosome partitioning or flagellar assembly/CheY-like chemotaxis protein
MAPTRGRLRLPDLLRRNAAPATPDVTDALTMLGNAPGVPAPTDHAGHGSRRLRGSPNGGPTAEPAVRAPHAIARSQLPGLPIDVSAAIDPEAQPRSAASPKAAPKTRKRRVQVVDQADFGVVVSQGALDRSLRIILVEDVPDVTSHIRELLRAQSMIRMVDVVRDGRSVATLVRELRPDVVVVDLLLQGRVSGATVIERLRKSSSTVPIVALAVADQPIDVATRARVDGVVTMPFGTYDLVRAIRDAATAGAARNPSATSRIVAVHAAKGGVGKTTIAYNLAVALAQAGLKAALIDGSLQYGDLRRQLRVGPEVPSICDLPTGNLRQSDLEAGMHHDSSGVDILLAPPRLEMADLVSVRDIEEILQVARRAYQAIVIDTPSALNENTLAMLDLSDVILQVLTPESAALDSTRAAVEAFAAIGYPASKVRTVINRVDAVGGLSLAQLRRGLGRDADHVVASDWPLVSTSNSEGVPFVGVRPGAKISKDVYRLAYEVCAVMVMARPARRAVRASA